MIAVRSVRAVSPARAGCMLRAGPYANGRARLFIIVCRYIAGPSRGIAGEDEVAVLDGHVAGKAVLHGHVGGFAVVELRESPAAG